MGKYVKYALVLLYVAQLVIAFREQMVHIYRNAVNSAQREAGLGDVARHHPVVSVRRAIRPAIGSVQALYAAPRIAVVAAMNGGPEAPEHDPGDEYKNRAKRANMLKRVDFLLLNLYPFIRRRRAAPSATEEERGRQLPRTDIFPKTAHAA